MAETILVTGATGTVGRRVVAQLLSDGGDKVRVNAAVHTASRAHEVADTGAHPVDLNLDDPGSVERAVAGADRVFLLTAGLNMSLQVNNVISAALASNVKSIVRLSVLGAEDEPGITLTRLHRSAELAIMGSGLDWTFLRPTSFMQNFETMAETIKASGQIPMPTGQTSMGYIDALDIARVASAVLLDNSNQHSGRAYDLTGPEALNPESVGAVFSKVLGRDIKGFPIPVDAAAEAMTQQGLPGPLVDALRELYTWIREQGDAALSNSVYSVTGRQPNTLERYVADNKGLYE